MVFFKKWILKAFVQKAISYLPRHEHINYFFQKRVTGGVQLTDEHFGYKIEHAADHIMFMNKYRKAAPETRILELGTGWYPIVPLMFYLTDSGRVASVDIRNWMDKGKKIRAIQKLFEWDEKKKLSTFFKDLNRDKWENLHHILQNPEKYSTGRINEVIGLEQIIGDAAHLEIEDHTFDFICSNNTLEHIHKDQLRNILLEFKRVLKPAGVMSHFIDCTDHFAHFDKSISIYNFLKFSERGWRIIDNRIQPQNRLRFVDYRELFTRLDIPVTEESVRSGDVELLNRIRLNDMYSHYSFEDLAVSHGYIVSVMDPAKP